LQKQVKPLWYHDDLKSRAWSWASAHLKDCGQAWFTKIKLQTPSPKLAKISMEKANDPSLRKAGVYLGKREPSQPQGDKADELKATRARETLIRAKKGKRAERAGKAATAARSSMSRSTKNIETAEKQIRKTLESRYLIPLKSDVGVEELVAFMQGERSLPAFDLELFRCVKNLLQMRLECKYEHGSLKIPAVVCPKNMRVRLNYLLATDSKKRLVYPRPNREFSLFFMTYCCLFFDRGNLTLWSHGPQTLQGECSGGWISVSARQKIACLEKLKSSNIPNANEIHNGWLTSTRNMSEILDSEPYENQPILYEVGYSQILEKKIKAIAENKKSVVKRCISVARSEEDRNTLTFLTWMILDFDPMSYDCAFLESHGMRSKRHQSLTEFCELRQKCDKEERLVRGEMQNSHGGKPEALGTAYIAALIVEEDLY
jgi:hypothetical protein